MLKQSWRLISRIEKAGDFLIAIAAFFAAYYGRASLIYWDRVFDWDLPFEGAKLAPLKDYILVLMLALFAQTIVLHLMGAYSSMRLRSSAQLLQMFTLSSLIIFFTLAAALFMLKLDFSRSFIGLFCVLLVLMLSAQRYLVVGVLRVVRRRGYNFRNLVICGTGEQALKLAAQVYRKPELGLRIRCVANLLDREQIDIARIASFRERLKAQTGGKCPRILLGKRALEKALQEYAVDEVIFTDIVAVMPAVEDLILLCAEQGVRTTLAADLFSIGMVKSGLSYFGGMPLIHFQTPPGDRWELILKRVIDVVVAALLLVVLAPLMALIAALVKLSSPGPVFFVQKRVGMNGHLFDFYKFRSMYVGAEQQLEALKEHNEMQGPAFKLRNDPRVTPIGRWLRRYSLDELPQLWNVLRGDMSLVGPRPPVPGEVSAYERRYRRRLSMRPGMTCTWQVSGRSEISDFSSWVQLDLEYIDNWSLGRDLMLLFRTIPAVIFGVGAR